MHDLLLGQNLRRMAFDESGRLVVEYGLSEREGEFLSRFLIPRPEHLRTGASPTVATGLVGRDEDRASPISLPELPGRLVADLSQWLDSTLPSLRTGGNTPLLQLILEYRRVLDDVGRGTWVG